MNTDMKSITVICPKCSLTGKIDAAKMPPQGGTLTCPRCKEQFPVAPHVPEQPPESGPLRSECPACGTQHPTAESCTACGLLYGKYRPRPPKTQTAMPPEINNNDFMVSTADIRNAVREGIIETSAAARLIDYLGRFHHGSTEPAPLTPTLEPHKGLNLVMVAYYLGAMLMISACAWFLGDKWKELGSPGIFVTVAIYMLITGRLGFWLRSKGYTVGGGLLVTVAVCLTPLLTYTIEDMTGLWPGKRPGEYKDYYPWINGSWIVMELATISVALLALRWVRFAFLTAPIAFSFWFFSMDVAAIIVGNNSLSWDERKWVSVLVGLMTMAVGYGLDRTLHKPGEPRSEDFAFWCYFFGLLAFWGGLTAMNSGSEVGKLIYCLINLGLIGLAIYLRRSTFLVFGALGVHVYLGHLAYDVFRNTFLFPFALALLGLSLILVTVWAQKRFRHLLVQDSSAHRLA